MQRIKPVRTWVVPARPDDLTQFEQHIVMGSTARGDHWVPAFVKRLRESPQLQSVTFSDGLPRGRATDALALALASHPSIEHAAINALGSDKVRRIVNVLRKKGGTESLSSLSLGGRNLLPRSVGLLALLIDAGLLKTLRLQFDLSNDDVLRLLGKGRPNGPTTVVFHPPESWSPERKDLLDAALRDERRKSQDALHRVHGFPLLAHPAPVDDAPPPPDECIEWLRNAHALCERWARFVDPSSHNGIVLPLPHELRHGAARFEAHALVVLQQLRRLPDAAPALAHLAPDQIARCTAVLEHARQIGTRDPARKLAHLYFQQMS